MLQSQVYEDRYSAFHDHMPFLVQAMAEEAGTTINSAAKAGGSDGVQALFDAVMDAGHRQVLVSALNSPAINGWVREKLMVFLYGQTRKVSLPALLVRTFH